MLVSCQGVKSVVIQPTITPAPPAFDGQIAFNHVAYQVSLGPRFPGSEGHSMVQEWIVESLQQFGWTVEFREAEINGHSIKNIVAYRQNSIDSDQEWVILGAHYDTRFISELDPNPSKQSEPGLGANDGASGVAVLLEMARVLPILPDAEVWLVFFDAEDNGRIPGWDWVMGSTVFADQLETKPDKVVVVDLVGDADQNIYIEKSSDPELVGEIWQTAADLNIQTFISEPKHRILDDHTPFLMQEIPAVDIIDFDYPYRHTTQDTLDKISVESLQNVGDILLNWLVGK
jgi:glutaminyl-peptide cyclotransferase